jgi:hypothetical protein
MRTRPRRLAVVLLVLCGALTASRAVSQDVPLTQILLHVGAYVDGFQRELTGIIAEETYVQDSGRIHRELKSDFLLVRAGSDARYVEFRDVFEVDGKAVRDRQDRLTRLFFDPSASAIQQLRAIVAESARYNIGRIERTLNTPTLPLLFLLPGNQHGSIFAVTNKTTPELAHLDQSETPSSDFSAPPDTVVITFDEGRRNTLIRGARDRDLPAHGRFWVAPTTGRVLMSELVADDPDVRAVIDVSYRTEPSVDFLVPAEMRERYEPLRSAGALILGRATYARFRKFQVRTSTDIPPAK